MCGEVTGFRRGRWLVQVQPRAAPEGHPEVQCGKPAPLVLALKRANLALQYSQNTLPP